MRVTQSLLSLLVAGCLITFVGCGSSETKTTTSTGGETVHEEHAEEHAHPETYDDAVTELKELTEEIRLAFKQDEVEVAHEPLHEVGHILEIVETLSQESDLPDEAKASVKEAVNTLFEAFGAVDDKLHGEEGKDFADVSDAVDASLKVLTEQFGKVAGTAKASGPADAPGEVPEVSEVAE